MSLLEQERFWWFGPGHIQQLSMWEVLLLFKAQRPIFLSRDHDLKQKDKINQENLPK
jgi:hypothetical protein